MKHFNVVKRYGAGVGAAVGSALLIPVVSVQAAVPAAVSTTFTEMGSDFDTIFAAGFTVLAAITLAMIAWKYTRKLGAKL